MPPTGPQLVHAVRRNFGGLKEENLDPEEIFWSLLRKDVDRPPDLESLSADVSHPHYILVLWYSGFSIVVLNYILSVNLGPPRCILL